ncbi:MAG: discoidin domain-containing protein, partial [Lachnospiraceae bacterium]|nr:discoidin domain-containing protein [Lachnospiraceae bacterium]
MQDKKKYMLAGAVLAVVLAAVGLIGVLLRGQHFGDVNPNLALKRGVKATCDSVEQETLSAAMAIDGNDTDRASRWSSENNREDASHYMQLEFPEEISVSFVVLKWERANVVSYALESSADGEVWQTLQSFETAPEILRQEIILDKPVQLRYLRLSTYQVSKEEADFSDLYQNVSLYEFEVYEDKPTAYKLKTPVIETAADGARRLVMPEIPEGFQVSLIGADLEQVIGADGRVYDTIQDKDVTVGYLVEDLQGREETREVSFKMEVPAAKEQAPDVLSNAGTAAEDEEADWARDEETG